MSGTTPLVGLGIQTVVRLTIGLSKTPRLKFAWGAPVDALTVGMRSSWPVLADKLLDVHMHLGFDGEHLLVALAAPEAVVHVNGSPIHGHRWWPVEAPAEIRAGGAVFKVETEAPDTVPLDQNQADGEPIDTVYDGGMLREHGRVLANQRAIAPPVARPPVNVDMPTMLSTPHEAPARPATPLPPAPPLAPAAAFAPLTSPPSAPPVNVPIQVDEDFDFLPKKAGFWRQASGPKKAIVVLLPLALAAILYDSGLLPGRPTAPATHAALRSRPEPGQAAAAASPPRLSPQPAAPATASAPRLSTQPAAPATSATPAPSAAPAPSGSAAQGTISARPGATGALSPDRAAKQALDLAFTGNLKEASRVYAELAAANPQEPAFTLAARLTAAQAVQRP